MDKLTMEEIEDMVVNHRERLLVMTIINDMDEVEPDPKAWYWTVVTYA